MDPNDRFCCFWLACGDFTAGLFLNIRRRNLFDLGIGLLTFFGFGLALIGLFRTDPIGGLTTLSAESMSGPLIVSLAFPCGTRIFIIKYKKRSKLAGVVPLHHCNRDLGICSSGR